MAGYTKLTYRPTSWLSTHVGGAIGNESFRVQTSQEIESVNSKSLSAGFSLKVSRYFSIGFNYEYEDREGQYKRNIFSISLAPNWN